jgi:hypothetical protein
MITRLIVVVRRLSRRACVTPEEEIVSKKEPSLNARSIIASIGTPRNKTTTDTRTTETTTSAAA